MSPHQTARKFQATRGVNGRVSVALGLGLPVAPIVLKPATIPSPVARQNLDCNRWRKPNQRKSTRQNRQVHFGMAISYGRQHE